MGVLARHTGPILLYSCLISLIIRTNSLSINVHTSSNQTLQIAHKYTYTTLGTPPNYQPIRSTPIFLSSYNFSRCKFSQTTNIASLQGKFVVLVSLPVWYECAYEKHGVVTAVGRLIQRAGGIGVVIKAQEKFRNGRILAFENSIQIPFIAIPSGVMAQLVKNQSNIDIIEFPPISESESASLRSTYIQYTAAIICSSILCFLASLFLIYSIFEDFTTRSMVNWHSVSWKVIAITINTIAILYVTIDPFSFKGYWFWNTAIVFNLHTSLFVIALMLLLQFWIVTTGNALSKIVTHRFFPRSVHTLAIAVVFTGIIQGSFPAVDAIQIFFATLEIVIACICGIGLIFFGTNIIHILKHSGNASQNHRPLKRRIIYLIIGYFLINETDAIVLATIPLGFVGSLMFDICFGCILIFAASLILFLPPIINRKRKAKKLTTVPSTINFTVQSDEV